MPDALLGTHWKDALTGADVKMPGEFDLLPYQYHIYKKL